MEWLKQFEGSFSKSVPLLVCLTFGDRLFVECQEDQGGYHPEHMKKAIATELKVKIDYYAFTLLVTLSVTDTPSRVIGAPSLLIPKSLHT